MMGAHQQAVIADQEPVGRPVEVKAHVRADIVVGQNFITDPEQHHKNGSLPETGSNLLAFDTHFTDLAQALCH